MRKAAPLPRTRRKPSTVTEQIKNLPISEGLRPRDGRRDRLYELARQLGVEHLHRAQGRRDRNRARAFTVGSDKILIAEDVITTGKSTMETVRALEELGAEVIGAACIADRRADDCDFALPVYAALKLAIDSYEPDDCPICREGKIKLEKPGSRELPVAK
ncbi:MAG: phosphoribosyltransferase family protein [Eubacteriales bacterium]